MAGRRPKPTKLKIIEGNRGKRPMNKREAKPKQASRVPKPPKHLGKIARAEWRRVAPELYRVGLLTTLDTDTLAGYCMAHELIVEASQKLQAEPLVTRAPSGYQMQNPLLSIINTAQKQLRAFAIELGMTPSARSRIEVEPPAESADELEKILSGG